MSASFVAWACDPARNLEERYSVEQLVEVLLPDRHKDPNASWTYNFEAQQLRRKARQLNPAYQPELIRAEIEQIAPALAASKQLDFSSSEDRPVRDLGFLQFCPALVELQLFNTDIHDWSPLRCVPGLTKLLAGNTKASDLRPIADLTALQTLWLRVQCPWPDLTGFERLEGLREFHYHGNILALRAIRALPAVRDAQIGYGALLHTPLRDLHDLPEMPALRRLHLENTWRLDGIERSPRLLNLTISGCFDDLSPLAALRELTHLELFGGEYTTLAPLAALPELRRLLVRREEPQDYSVLAEMPRLHEVAVERCPTSRLEVATLNAALNPWSDDFGIDPPRPLAPLRLLLRRKTDRPEHFLPAGVPKRAFGEDRALAKSESDWLEAEVPRRLTALLGKGWRSPEAIYCFGGGGGSLTITRLEDIERLPLIIEEVRRLLAACRYGWQFHLVVDTLERYERDLDEISDDDGEEEKETFDAERERQDWEDNQARRRERREFLERTYRFKLQQQGGMEIRPEEFAPALPALPPEDPAAQSGSDYGAESRLYLSGHLTETVFLVSKKYVALAEYLTDLKAEVPAEEPSDTTGSNSDG